MSETSKVAGSATCKPCVNAAYQVIQSSHEGFKLMLPDAALVQGSKGGASPAHGAGWVGLMDGAVQQNQVLFTTGRAQSCNLTTTKKERTDYSEEAALNFSLFQLLLHEHTFKSCERGKKT